MTISITNSSKFIALAVGVGLVLAVAFGGMVSPANAALSASQVSSILSLLSSFGADAATIANVNASLTGGTPSGGTSGGCSITSDLTMGSSGAEVTCLQQGLISMGFSIPAGATGYFGAQTQAAVSAWQTSKNIAPAAGYFGPISRAAWVTTGGGTTGGGTTGGSLSGGEGSLDVNGNLGDVENDVKEGENDVQILGVELEAQDSDIMLERVDIEITLSGTGSSQLDNYVDEVSVWLDGEKLASLDVDEADEDDSDVFSFRFTGLDGTIEEDEVGELYFAVTAVNNVDSGDVAKILSADVPANGVRAVDGAGISETYVTAGEVSAETFSVVEETTGDLDLTEGDSNPEGQVVSVDEDNDTDDVLVLAFDLEADNQDATIDDIPVGLTTTGLTGGIDVAVKRAILKMDGSVIDTVSITSTASANQEVLFTDLNIDLQDGDTAEFEVLVDLYDAEATSFATSSTLYATTTGSDSDWDVEDAEGDSVTPNGAVTNSGDLLVFQTEGISVDLVSTSKSIIFAGETAGQKQIGEFKIVVSVSAIGEDMYVDKDATEDGNRDGSGSAGAGFMWATSTQSTTGTTSIAAVVTASGSTSGDTATTYKIDEGETRTFTLTVTLEAGIDGVSAVQLFGINWDKESADTTPDNFYTSNMSDFKTDLQTLLII